jgi:hypothetical protein
MCRPVLIAIRRLPKELIDGGQREEEKEAKEGREKGLRTVKAAESWQV